jgi:hypothetical protein
MNTNNPLKQYFRQPAIFIRLPSQGRYYPPGAIEIPENMEFPVYPMTAIDEITYRTPDALFNGEAVASVIESCIPAIKNAWALPSVDLDSILIAIRIASYGHNMDFESTCTHCNNVEERSLDLRIVLDNLTSADYSTPIVKGDIEIFFKPMNYKNLTDNNKAQYEEQRILAQMPSTMDAERERNAQYNEVLKRMTELTVKALSQSIALIKTPTAQVTELEHILEFLTNCDRKVFNQIRDYILESKAKGEIQPLKMTCSQCNKEFEQSVSLNMSDFFGDAS